jgi:hypothetical protein
MMEELPQNSSLHGIVDVMKYLLQCQTVRGRHTATLYLRNGNLSKGDIM